ncbi:fumarylacetoacetate hydrolase family protein [Nostoc sp.]|uniref:fumarylacetoacetate hydrolase family protein n=1 Tax=Nostoc sp. TaxID=1180 RepID=UPI002FFD1B2C
MLTTYLPLPTLVPGDVIVSDTPAGVGMARKPPLLIKPADVVEVEVEQLCILQNTICDPE